MISQTLQASKPQPGIIHGFVLDMATKKPLMWVHINITAADETSLTNEKGEFKVLSWKKMPLTLNIRHEDFEPLRVTITDFRDSLLIMLQRSVQSYIL